MPVVRRPLAHVLELGDERLGGNELLLRKDEDRIGLDPPRIRLRLPLLAGPDRGAVLEHPRLHLSNSREGLDTRDVEEDLVARLGLEGLPAKALLDYDH